MSSSPKSDPSAIVQNFFHRLARPIGFVVALFLFVNFLYCVYLTLNSAFVIGGAIHLLAVILIAFVLTCFFFLQNFIRRNHLVIGDRPVDQFALMLACLLCLGFTQTFFWVIDPTGIGHEPRSVFILATAGILAFFRNQNERSMKSRSGS